MAKVPTSVATGPNTRSLAIIAQDPAIRARGAMLMANVTVPAEELAPGPRGYRVNVIDFDASTGTLYQPAAYPKAKGGVYPDPFAPRAPQKTARQRRGAADRLIADPRFHAQNVYAIAMRTLARFEFALGRRVPWGCDGHQIHIAPHAFSDANAFYSREDRAIFFGYFQDAKGRPIFTCLSHDVVAHETTHALLDGLRGRYMEPSSPDQAAFHEGFADIVALLSVFSLPDVVGALLGGDGKFIDERLLTLDRLKQSVLFGLALQMGQELSRVRGQALRRSVALKPGRAYRKDPAFDEPHDRGELIVAATLNAFLDIWLARLARIGTLGGHRMDRSLVVEEGARVADHLLTMSIRALDYCPPTDITFDDYLSALLTVDREVVPDDTKYGYRDALLARFRDYDIKPSRDTAADGTWKLFDRSLVYSRTHFDSMLRDRQEVFRFIWENREALEINSDGYVEVESVQPSIRVGPDGFTLRETVAEYVQILTLTVGELPRIGITPPKEMPEGLRVRIFGGGALVFNEYGSLKYQISSRLDDPVRQGRRLQYLWDTQFFEVPPDPQSHFALMHLRRALS